MKYYGSEYTRPEKGFEVYRRIADLEFIHGGRMRRNSGWGIMTLHGETLYRIPDSSIILLGYPLCQ